MEDCFSNIHSFVAGYEKAKGYCRADFDAPEVLVINEAKSTKEPGPCFKCSETHFWSRCTKDKGYPNNKFQKYKIINNPYKLCQNKYTNGQFPTGAISFQASQQIKAGDDISIECQHNKVFFFGKMGEKYTLQRKSNILSDAPKS